MNRLKYSKDVRMMTARSLTTLTAVLAASIAFTGCTTGGQPPQNSTTESAASASSTPADALPTPIEILSPDSQKDCTTSLDRSDDGLEDPDRVTIRCADKTTTVAGTFRDRYTNVYDPAAANDVEKIVVVGGEVRAWVRYGDVTCLIVHVPGEPSTECDPTEQPQAPTLEPVPEPTFTS